MKVKIADLEKLAALALRNSGYNTSEIPIILKMLMYAQLRGNNQGLVNLIGKGMPKYLRATDITVIKETKLSALLDGGKNFGMIVMNKALDLAIRKAKKHGFGIVGTNNTSSGTGAIGYYVNEIAKQGLIGFAFSGSSPTVAAHGSFEAIYGTNPLAIGIPADPEPVVLDMATAAIAWYGLIEAKTAGKQIPEGLAYDANGNPTTDPAKALKGAIKSFGGYKGSGLGFMVTAFTGPLVGAGFGVIGNRTDWGNVIMALDPELLINRQQFKQNVTTLAHKVKSTKKLAGVDKILLPGERGNTLTKQRLTAGYIEIEDNLYKELKKVNKFQTPSTRRST